MPKKKLVTVKFEAVDKQQIKGLRGHSRTGACQSRGKCYCGRISRRGAQ